eukprot:TRINITY_DN51751_c0_g1_i1.p1 TRINITY_DN51751_c0_g1~~TRINITY_DN51751_c0_g1_i1.p1  ORF type:complete len:627 (+),score=208.07 TRINITY_DN51751_c0_g1_i1:106-1986(+)
MPILQCLSSVLFQKLGKQFTEKEFDDLCWEFGIELDEVTSERAMYRREAGDAVKEEKALEKSDEEIYKIELPANRYDLLSVEGLGQALRTFGWSAAGAAGAAGAAALTRRPPPPYRLLAPKLRMTVQPSVLPIRPYVVCAVLRDITFTKDSYNSFIDLQEKLHHNIARKRTLVSVGTHDLDKIEGPFTYEATPKGEIDFLPLAAGDRGNLKGSEIDSYYAADKHIGRYVPLIRDFDRFPTIRDKKRNIMSLPPIINSDLSKIEMSTRNVFIEATALDHTKATIVVNVICAAFSEYCKEQYTVEPVEVEYPEEIKWVTGRKDVTPDFNFRHFTVPLDYINRSVGIQEDAQTLATLMERMCLTAQPSADGKALEVKVPPTRADVLHACDIMEDAAIAYGYDRILRDSQPPKTLSIGSQQPREKLSHMLRTEMALAGYSEMLTFSLCSHDEAFAYCRRADDGKTAAVIANPQTKEFQICRPSLLPGTMKTLNHSRSQPLPLKLMEVTDVIVKDPSHRVGARNERHVCAVCVPLTSESSSGFESIHGLFEYAMRSLGVRPRVLQDHDDDPNGYYIEECTEDGAFYPGRQVACFARQRRIGSFGVLHPHLLKSFEFPFPCSYLEFNLEPFV